MSRVPLIGDSPAMAGLRRMIAAVAASDATALISGESGTGKELVARALHQQSARVGQAFVPVNCGAIPRDLIESELFGHRKGSFTGALTDRIGRFQMAHGGTLFLDEIGDLPLDLQVKLLRVLQERVVDPIGSTQPVTVDVRVVAATHRDLETEVAAGRFRQDLYYRLNVLPLWSPPLRERGDDVPELLTYYGRHFARAGDTPVRYTPDTLAALCDYDWPGNVRELCNLVQRFSALYPGGCIDLGDLAPSLLPRGLWPVAQTLREAARIPPEIDPLEADPLTALAFSGLLGDAGGLPSMPSLAPTGPGAPHGRAGRSASGPGPDGLRPDALSSPLDFTSPLDARLDGVADALTAVVMAQGGDVLPAGGLCLRDHLAQIERSLIRQALSTSEGNVSQTAKLLRLQRTTLIEKLQKYDLRSPG